METISFRCSHCNTGLKVSKKAAGKVVRCAKCQKPVTVPEPTLAEMPVHGNGQAGFSEATTDEIEEMPAGWPARKGVADIGPKTVPAKSDVLPPFTLAPPKPTWLARSRPLAEAIGHSLGILWQKARARPWVAIAILGGALSTILISVVLLGVFYVLSTGGRPSETAIKQAITDYMNTHGIKNVHPLARQSNVKVDSIKIKDVGGFQKGDALRGGNYWPVRATVAGSVVIGGPFSEILPDNKERRHSFTDERVFGIGQDAFGKWVAVTIIVPGYE